MPRLVAGIVALIAAQMLSGCSAYMAANQPGQKDLSLLGQGQTRARLIAEFGQPIHSELKDGVRHDIFQWKQGYHAGVRAGRAIGHAAADVVTLGLWEIVGTPTEGYLNGTDLSAEVVYDSQDKVVQVVPLKGANELVAGSSIPQPQR